MAKKASIIAAEQGINTQAVAATLKTKAQNRTKFWEPKAGCIYRIKDAENNILIEYNLEEDVTRDIEVNVDYLIPFLFTDDRASEWSQAFVPVHGDLDDPIYLDWIIAEALPNMFRLKKSKRGTLYSESKDQYYELVSAPRAYQWRPYSFD
jgi:hypothetical protein